jgi:hypothetical protein
MKKSSLTLLTLSLAGLSAASADDSSEQAALIAVVDTFFAAMTARDVDKMRSILTPDGIVYGYRDDPDGLLVIRPTHEAYLNNLSMSEDRLVERYWDPTIMIHDRLATVWTPYDFHRDDVFSHCGVNNFSFLKTDTGWKITGVVFSMQRDGCADSPLGPYQAKD